MSGKTIGQSDTRLEAMKIQSSAYGVVIAMFWGVNRVAGNMLWYGGFKATPQTSSQGGKGGVRQTSTTHTYSASVMMALGHGRITDVPRAWVGKRVHSGGIVPSQILSATETYAVPGAGPMAYTTVHAATYAAHMLAWVSVGSGADAFDRVLQVGVDVTVAAGVYTLLDETLRGYTVTFQYQRVSGGYTQNALQELGLTFIAGDLGQAPWSGLASFGAQSIGYSGLAAVAGTDYDLGASASVENHSLEVVGPMAYHLGSTVPDVDPALMLRDLLSNARAGANFPGEYLDHWGQFSNYCVANGLLVSPVLTTQASAREVVERVAELTNAVPVWSSRRLKMLPRSDAAATGHGRTYTPAVTPVYALDDDCYAPPEGAPPVRMVRRRPADRFNHVRVEYEDRGQQYNTAIADARDLADIEARGLRSRDVVDAKGWLAEASAARRAAQLLMQRSLHVGADFEFWLPWHYARLEPGDIVTLTDTGLGLAAVGAWVTEIDESADGRLQVRAEEYPAGSNAAPAYPAAVSTGYQHDYNVAPGNAGTPVVFEVPAELTSTGLGLHVAVPAGASAHWGGAQVWASLDGTNYRLLGVAYGGARVGALNGAAAAGASSVAVDGLGSQQLLSGSAADAAALSTLCYVGGANPEYLAYTTATLTGAGAYTLAGLVHAAYGTPANAHADNDAFVRVDDRVLRSDDLDPSMVGKTVYLKACSFNVYGGAQQGLADVSATTYVVTGAMLALAPAGSTRTFRQAAAPANPRTGDVWVNTTTGAQQRWSGTAWEPYAEYTLTLGRHGAEAANIAIGGNGASRVGGTPGWNAAVHSLVPIANGCRLTFTLPRTDRDVVVGLNVDPLTDASYTSVDFALSCTSLGTYSVFESGSNKTAAAAYAADVPFVIEYDGTAVRYFYNGALVRQVAAEPGRTYYLDASLYQAGAAVRSIRFDALTPVPRGNLVDASAWISGNQGNQGSSGGNRFSANGATSQSSIVLDYAPDGALREVWRCTTNGGDPNGGWQWTDRVPVDHRRAYRFAVWVKQVAMVTGAGYAYLGLGADVVDLPSEAPNNNPYFVAQQRVKTNFAPDRWYLMVGFVLPSTYGTTQLGMGGIWDGVTGQKVAAGVDFKWRTTTSDSYHRSFMYYAADTSNDMRLWGPRMEMVDGTEPSVDQLLAMARPALGNVTALDFASALGLNGQFSNWLAGQLVPDGWQTWGDSSKLLKETVVTRSGPNAFRVQPAGADAGAVFVSSVFANPIDGYLRLAVDARIVSHTSGGKPGVYVRLWTEATAANEVTFMLQPPSMAVGEWQTLAANCAVPPGLKIHRIYIYLMGSWGSFPGGHWTGDVIYDSLLLDLVRPAGSNEIGDAAATQVASAGGASVLSIAGVSPGGSTTLVLDTITITAGASGVLQATYTCDARRTAYAGGDVLVRLRIVGSVSRDRAVSYTAPSGTDWGTLPGDYTSVSVSLDAAVTAGTVYTVEAVGVCIAPAGPPKPQPGADYRERALRVEIIKR